MVLLRQKSALQDSLFNIKGEKAKRELTLWCQEVSHFLRLWLFISLKFVEKKVQITRGQRHYKKKLLVLNCGYKNGQKTLAAKKSQRLLLSDLLKSTKITANTEVAMLSSQKNIYERCGTCLLKCESVFLLKDCLRYIKSNTNIKSRPYENRDLHIIYRKFPVCRKIALSHTLLLSDATSFSSLDYIYVMYVYKHKCLFYQNISFSDFWPSVESGWSLLKVKLLGEMK